MKQQNSIIKRDFFSTIKQDFMNIARVDEGQYLREVGFAIQHLNNQPYLLKSGETTHGQNSLRKAVLNVALTGLTLNPVSKQAFLVPRWNRDRKCVEAYLEPSYIGLCKLLTDTQSVRSITSQLIWKGDDVEIDMADEKKVIKHIPYILTGNEKGGIVAVYSLATLHDGSYHCEIMSIDDVYDIRERSESYKAMIKGKTKTCIWKTDEGEMIRKTVLKRHYKYLPKSDRAEFLEQAIDLDNGMHGIRHLVKPETIYYIEDLIHECTLDEDQKQHLENVELPRIEYTDQANKMIEMLKLNQPSGSPRDGGNYSQKQINMQLDLIDDNE